MNNKYPYISKTNYKQGLQCPKLLWYKYHNKALFKKYDPIMRFVFDEGKRVGELAQKMFPDGIKIDRMLSPEGQHRQSTEALKQRKPLFEAGFTYNQAYALADILVPVDTHRWDIYEVKSGTSLDEHHYQDIAFQKYVYEGAGLAIRNCYLLHINKEFVRHGEINPKEFFVIYDATNEARLLSKTIDEELRMMLEIIEQKEEPEMAIGQHCRRPHSCPLQEMCWAFLPKDDSVFDLYSGGKLAFQMFEDGIVNIREITNAYKLNEKQLVQLEAVKDNKVHMDKPAIRAFLSKIEYPACFVDFETLGCAIPVYDNVGPYEAVPFQYSLYIVDKLGAKPRHFQYLAPGDKDPRPEILEQLQKHFGDKGSIIAYWAPFEKGCIKKSGLAYPEYKKWSEDVQERFVDLLEPFKSFAYYDPKQGGSASLKSVLPALTKMNYEGLDISEGGSASAEYYTVTFNDKVSPGDRERVREALVKYCDIDTLGMVEVVNALQKAVG